jgi:predicted nucleic acid-binding protein
MTRVYYDNMLASAIVLDNLRWPTEMAALRTVERLHSKGLIKRVTSRESWREQSRTRDHGQREALRDGQDLVSVVQADHRVVGFSQLEDQYGGFFASPLVSDVVDQALYDALTAAGLASADARHLMYAVHNGCDVFLTTDKHFTDRRPQLEKACSGRIRILRPSEFVAGPR